MSLRTVFALTVLVFVVTSAGPVTAQTTHGFVVRLGADTISIEHVTRTAMALRVQLLERSPVLRRSTYEIRWHADGGIADFEYRTARSSRPGSGVLRMDATIVGDSVIARSWRDDSLLRRVAVRRTMMAFPWLLGSIAAYEVSFQHLQRLGSDSVTVLGVAPGPMPGLVPRTMRRATNGEFTYPFFLGQKFFASLDTGGNLVAFSGRETTIKYEAERTPAPDIDALERELLARESSGGALGALSPRDTVRAEIAGARLLVDYSRPRARKRVILGGVVPFDTVWRTGADAATQFQTDRNLTFCRVDAECDVHVPAGSYTLWTIPSRNGVTLIVNKQTGQWGTSYDATHDFVKIPLVQRRGLPVEEAFTIRIVHSEGETHSRVVLRWDDFEWQATFRVLQRDGWLVPGLER